MKEMDIYHRFLESARYKARVNGKFVELDEKFIYEICFESKTTFKEVKEFCQNLVGEYFLDEEYFFATDDIWLYLTNDDDLMLIKLRFL
jgi:hypothetical protein